MLFEPPADWLCIHTIDAHTAGEPLRVITAGYPELSGKTMLEKRQDALVRFDHLRRTLMWEPRGHADMYGCVLTRPVTPDGDVGVVFMHNEGYSTMCGHGIIGLVKVAIDTGLIRAKGDKPIIRIDTPAGRVTATAQLRSGRVERVAFTNVPSFVLEHDLEVALEGFGRVTCDIAFGGAFYAYVDARSLGIEIEPAQLGKIIDLGRRIKQAVRNACRIIHPEGDEDLNFLYGTIFVQDSSPPVHSRNVCVFADGEVDRSPTGTGVSGRAAILHALGKLALGETITIESVIGTRFDVRVVAASRVGPIAAVIPEVSGTAHITGRHEFFIDPEDPLREGVLLR
ncbi:MAG: proline racemase family protein [Planctomycetota bacterium]